MAANAGVFTCLPRRRRPAPRQAARECADHLHAFRRSASTDVILQRAAGADLHAHFELAHLDEAEALASLLAACASNPERRIGRTSSSLGQQHRARKPGDHRRGQSGPCCARAAGTGGRSGRERSAPRALQNDRRCSPSAGRRGGGRAHSRAAVARRWRRRARQAGEDPGVPPPCPAGRAWVVDHQHDGEGPQGGDAPTPSWSSRQTAVAHVVDQHLRHGSWSPARARRRRPPGAPSRSVGAGRPRRCGPSSALA